MLIRKSVATAPVVEATAAEAPLRTRVVHCMRDEYDVYIGRPHPSIPIEKRPKGYLWGNRFVIGRDGTRKEVVLKYMKSVLSNKALVSRIRLELRGKVLGCWCHPEMCHGDVLAMIADGLLPEYVGTSE